MTLERNRTCCGKTVYYKTSEGEGWAACCKKCGKTWLVPADEKEAAQCE